MRKLLVLVLVCATIAAGILLLDVPPDTAAPESGQSTEQASSPQTAAVTAPPIADTASESVEVLLVNAQNPLSDDYYPENLISLYDQKQRHFSLAKADIEICEAVFNAMESMFIAAEKDGVEEFIITSGYRTREAQEVIFAKNPDNLAARPGASEHETGLAFDVTAYGDKNFALTPQFEWLSAHCSEYGFIIRYPEGKEDITGYQYEPWHYRYVGEQHAKAIMDDGITLEEYITSLE